VSGSGTFFWLSRYRQYAWAVNGLVRVYDERLAHN
jgi:hypothetical protein